MSLSLRAFRIRISALLDVDATSPSRGLTLLQCSSKHMFTQRTGVVMSTVTLANFLQSPWLRPFNDPALIRGTARALNPLHQSVGIGAKVVEVINETPDSKTFVLQSNQRWPGKRWPGHLAGQHTTLTLSIDGRQLSRTFSIVTPAAAHGRIALTVKRARNNGKRISVSNWMFERLTVGQIVQLSEASGDFFLKNQVASKLLLLSAGSGITPVMAILRQLHASARSAVAITFLHICRSESDFIFAAELRALAARWPALRLVVHFSGSQGRFVPAQLAELVPDLDQHEVYLCGPTAFAKTSFTALRDAGVQHAIHQESFGGFDASELATSDAEDVSQKHAVSLASNKQSFTVSTQINLLEAMESAGLNPAFGCRIGICKTCQCVKRFGVVKNLRTGEISDAPNELIQLCVSSARSALELAI